MSLRDVERDADKKSWDWDNAMKVKVECTY